MMFFAVTGWMVGVRVRMATFVLSIAGSISPVMADERIIDVRQGMSIPVSSLLERVTPARFILLGEVHDNPHHHQRRGELILALQKQSPVVVAEHLEFGHVVAREGELLGALESAGFDARGWRWPVTEPLFAQIRSAGIAIRGANIPKPVARRLVREGEGAMPEGFSREVLRTEWSVAGQTRLEDELSSSHCGQLDAAMVPGLRLAQRGRDTAMYTALIEVSGQAILVAGNGHVRRDYGVPVLLAAHQPTARVAVVGFAEDTPELVQQLPRLRDVYDYLWVTPTVERKDPCAGFGKSS